MRQVIFLFILVAGVHLYAKFQTVVTDIVIEEASERKARTEALEKASQDVTYEMIEKEIGATQALENKNKIDEDIQSLKNRFIPYTKVLSSRKEKTSESEDAYRFKIEMKVSRQDLRTILQQKGLYAGQNKTGIVLPFIEVSNQESGESYRWWETVFTTSRDLESFSLTFEDELAQGFMEKGLFLLKPQSFHMVHMIPPFMRKAYLTQTDKVQLTSLKKGQLFIDGRVDVMDSPVRERALRVRVQLSCKQAANGKSIAEVVRVFDSEKGKKLTQLSQNIKSLARESGEDLASQVYDLWQRGALESELIKLAVTGSLTHQQLEEFKRGLKRHLRTDSLTERLFEPGQVTYEMNYTGGSESLSQKLGQSVIEGFASRVISSEEGQVTLKVQATQ